MSQAKSSTSQALMCDKTFAEFQALILQHTGIQLADAKRPMFVNRFSKRLNALNISCFEEYLKIVSDAHHPETIEFIDTITTNLTYFFREPHHFDELGKVVLPQLVKNSTGGKPIRIWSAGCSAGQEPYSIAITALDNVDTSKNPVKILCTDIHTKLVEKTRVGKYRRDELRGLSDTQLNKWFTSNAHDVWQADTALRELLLCKQLNLFSPWPVRVGVDVIMCRNVLIYFSPEYQRKLLRGFSAVQSKGSYLFLGHSETPDGLSKIYKRVANTVYERL
jgi:chemotaxis protein methyltransferase CheR